MSSLSTSSSRFLSLQATRCEILDHGRGRRGGGKRLRARRLRLGGETGVLGCGEEEIW